MQDTQYDPDDMRYIVYNTGRWYVRFQQNSISRSFRDSDYGGKEASLAAAKKWRDTMMASHPSLAKGYEGRARKEIGKPRRNNNTGIDGVTLGRDRSRKRLFFNVHWTDEARHN